VIVDRDEAVEGRKYLGKYKGWVRANDDPERRGRVRCYCPQVMGPIDDEPHWLGWAEGCLPWLGGINTLDFGPPLTKQQNGGVDVGVWLEFEGGNPDFPVWVGTFIVAPTPTSPNAQLDLNDAAGATGGSLIQNPPAGSDLAALSPPKPLPNENETRMLTKRGRDLVLGSKEGGYIILGPHGVSVVGPQVLLNGRLMDASSSDSAVG